MQDTHCCAGAVDDSESPSGNNLAIVEVSA